MSTGSKPQTVKPISRFSAKHKLVLSLCAQIIALPLIGLGIHMHSETLASNAALDSISKAQSQNLQGAASLVEPIKSSVRVAAKLGSLNPDFFRNGESVAYLDEILLSSNVLDAVYIGFQDGSMRQNLKVSPKTKVRGKDVPAGAALAHRWLDKTVVDAAAGVQDIFKFTDSNMAQIQVGEEWAVPGTYDPRARPWYTSAQSAGAKLTVTDPYVFSTKGLIGLTIEQPFYRIDGTLVGVFATDLTMDNLSKLLSKNSASPNAVSMIIDEKERIIAHNDEKQSTRIENSSLTQNGLGDIASKLPSAALTAAQGSGAKPYAVNFEGKRYLASVTEIKSFDKSWRMLTVAPMADFVAVYANYERNYAIAAGCLLGLQLLVFGIAYLNRRKPAKYADKPSQMGSATGFANA